MNEPTVVNIITTLVAQNILTSSLPSRKRDMLRFGATIIKHHQEIGPINIVQARPHTRARPNRNLISPCSASIPTRNQLSCRTGRVA